MQRKNQKTNTIKHYSIILNPMEYTIYNGKDDTLCSYEFPQHYKELMVIVAELRKQRHLALEKCEFTRPNISKNQLNYPFPKRSKINNDMQTNYNTNSQH